MTYIFQPPATVSVAIKGRVERFPVNRIYCVGRNYAAHAREMGKDPDRDPSFFFCKPGDLIYTGTPAGVGAVERGQLMQGCIDGLETLTNRVV